MHVREGPAGFTDKIALHIRQVNRTPLKMLGSTTTGEHQVKFPELDNFHGNPLLMLRLSTT